MANAIDQLTDRVLVLGRLTIVRRAITAVAVTISAVLQTFLIQAFIQPADLLPSGLTGVAVLLDRVTSLGGVHIDISLGMLALNIPVALLCWSGISKRFVIFSMMQVVLSSLSVSYTHLSRWYLTMLSCASACAWSTSRSTAQTIPFRMPSCSTSRRSR